MTLRNAPFTAAELARYRSKFSIFAYAGGATVRLDGWFRPDHLEAIACWMRDPVGVAKA